MVLRLKTRESRSLPGLQSATYINQSSQSRQTAHSRDKRAAHKAAFCVKLYLAGWSSPVARQAHNLKAAGSNPAPATRYKKARYPAGFFVSRNGSRS